MPSYCIIRYLGSKNRMAPLIAERLHATGRDTLVDVFGGSAAVTLNTGFQKRIYNDIDGDLVNLFRVLADPPPAATVAQNTAVAAAKPTDLRDRWAGI
jgi:DNA adenine methylase